MKRDENQNQRKKINYIKNAGLSKGYYLHVLVGGLAFLGILVVYASTLLREMTLVVSTLPDASVAASLQDRIITIAIIFVVCFLAFLLSTVFYIIILSHRVGGPSVAIITFINELKKGNYEYDRTLRLNDELGPIMSELKELAAILKNKK